MIFVQAKRKKDRVQRIRCVGIVLRENKLLMVRHKHPQTGVCWLMPPGGGLIGDETLYEACVREVYEETQLETYVQRILYVRQFLEDERNYHNLEIYIKLGCDGGLPRVGLDPEEALQYIQEVGFFDQAELQESDCVVHPQIMLDEFWQDLADDFPLGRLYLGQSSVSQERLLQEKIHPMHRKDKR